VLSDLLSPERVKVPLTSQSKDEVLRELVPLAVPSAGPVARDSIIGAVLDREWLLSTGIGSGIAHVRALGRISRILRNEAVRDDLAHATSAESFVQRLEGVEVS
jgi:mannitol/fructose-specific phosphotransferase system IIA component (Ntr-type)